MIIKKVIFKPVKDNTIKAEELVSSCKTSDLYKIVGRKSEDSVLMILKNVSWGKGQQDWQWLSIIDSEGDIKSSFKTVEDAIGEFNRLYGEVFVVTSKKELAEFLTNY